MIKLNLRGKAPIAGVEETPRRKTGLKSALVGAAVAMAASFAVAMPASAQLVTIQQVSSGRYLDAWEDAGHDYRAVVWSHQDNDTQIWRMTHVEGQVYTFQQVSSDGFLDAWENSDHDYDAVTRPWQNNNTQRWLVTDLGGGIHTIQQVSSGRYLDAWEDSGHGYRAVTRPSQNNATQQWRITVIPYQINPNIVLPNLDLVLEPAPPPPPPVHSSGNFDLSGAMMADLDSGVVGIFGGDFMYAAPDFVTLQLIPQAGAQLSFTNGNQRGYAGCNAAAFSNNPVDLVVLTPGDYVCARTDDGRISEFRINAIGPILKVLSIGYTTWQ